jgi:ABC-type uncharacterized transport system involved in gliding motility auxiliary subunit
MKQKGTYFFSALGAVILFVILVTFNWIAARAKVRVDLTAEHAYTLSKGTKEILGKLDSQVQIRFYFSRSDNHMPLPLKLYAQRVEDLLEEYRQHSNGHVEIQKLDPIPDSDAEESARIDNIDPFLSQEGDNLYLGLSFTLGKQKETLPLLEPTLERLAKREQLLEYQISRAITRVVTPDKPTIGLMTALPVMGSSPMMRRPGQQAAEAWYFYKELQKSFNITQVETSAEKIPDNLKVLVVIHPKGLSDATQYALDQFVLRGGKLVAFLDPLAALDPAAGGPMGGATSSSSLDKLLKAWGLSFESTKVLADMTYVARTQEGRMPTVLALTDQAVDPNDVLTSGMDNLFMAFAGTFSGKAADGLKEDILIKSSAKSQLVEPASAQQGGQKLIQDFSPSGVEYPIAVRLSGKFKTAFAEGKPKAPEPKPEDAKPGEPKPEKKPEAAAEPGLKESAVEGTVILVGDTDFLQDPLATDREMNRMTGQPVYITRNANIPFAQGAIEQLAGDSSLIAVRSRASRERPFTVVKKLEADAESRSQSKIKEYEANAADVDRKLMELLRTKSGGPGQTLILPPEQAQEIKNLRAKQAETRKALKEEKKTLRSEVDSLENRVKWYNIAVMPCVVIVVGIILAIQRRRKQAAA